MMKHIHKYQRVKFKSGYTIYRCMQPGCSHFVREELILNREAICWRCGGVFIITQLLKKPHCLNCVKKSPHAIAAQQLTERLLEKGVPAK